MKERTSKQKKKFIFIISLLIVVVLVVFVVTSLLKKEKVYDYKKIIKESDYDIVYSIKSEKDDTEIPVINIGNENIKKINSEIIELYEWYVLEKGKEFTYKYSVSDDVLSLLITLRSSFEGNTYLEYKSYVIDLDKLDVMSTEEILDKFDINKDDLNYFLINKFLNYYTDIVDKKILSKNECDFDCFIVQCNFEDFMEANSYYVNKNHLEVYKFFNIYTKYGYDNYFTEDSFRFVVK